MLIPNKFSGYQSGRRVYPAMGGVGEAMLLGAAVGGGSAAITGGDPLKGALLGGLTGGAGGALGGVLGGAGGTATTLATTGANAAGTAAAGTAAAGTGLAAGTGAAGLTAGTAGSTLGSSLGSSLAPTAGTAGSSLGSSLGSTAGLEGGVNYALVGGPSTMAPVNYALAGPASGGISSLAPGAGAATGAAPTTLTGGMAKFAADPYASLMNNKMLALSAGIQGATGAQKPYEYEEEEYDGPLSRYRFNPDTYRPAFAGGGIASLAEGGMGGYDRVVGEEPMYQKMARGGISSLGGYSDGGRMLKGPGDGMSDSIPASISGKRPARLADGEFVVPADVVSHLGNGSTDAGAKQLYSMMDKVRSARTGNKKQGRQIKPQKFMPA